MIKKVGIVGGAGYIGCVAADYFKEKKIEVEVFDTFYFNNEDYFIKKNIRYSNYDSRYPKKNIFKEFDLIIDLASISNDPSGELNPIITKEINFQGRVNTYKLAIDSGVKYYILASSCSVYGENKNLVNESSVTAPQTTYALANLEVERFILKNKVENFYPIIFRQATVFGNSPRLRLDLVVNALIYYAFKNKSINLLRDGTQWRPMVGVNDLSYLYHALTPDDFINNSYEIFNIGFNSNNFQVAQLGNEINKQFNYQLDINWYGDPDKRSYKVDFTKAQKNLPIKKIDTIEKTTKELVSFFIEEKFELSNYNLTLNWYKDLIENKKLTTLNQKI